MVKGEIAGFEQFLPLSQCFQKSSATEASESIYMWERVKIIAQHFGVNRFIVYGKVLVITCVISPMLFVELQTLWEKIKLFTKSNFSLTHNCFQMLTVKKVS